MFIQPSIGELKNALEIGGTLNSYSKELQKCQRDNSRESSNGYVFNPGGQEKYDDMLREIEVKRNVFYNSSDKFTNYFSNLGHIQKLEYIISKAIAILVYAICISLNVVFWIIYLVEVNRKKAKRSNKSTVKSHRLQAEGNH
jgi:hypothetical protein